MDEDFEKDMAEWQKDVEAAIFGDDGAAEAE